MRSHRGGRPQTSEGIQQPSRRICSAWRSRRWAAASSTSAAAARAQGAPAAARAPKIVTPTSPDGQHPRARHPTARHQPNPGSPNRLRGRGCRGRRAVGDRTTVARTRAPAGAAGAARRQDEGDGALRPRHPAGIRRTRHRYRHPLPDRVGEGGLRRGVLLLLVGSLSFAWIHRSSIHRIDHRGALQRRTLRSPFQTERGDKPHDFQKKM